MRRGTEYLSDPSALDSEADYNRLRDTIAQQKTDSGKYFEVVETLVATLSKRHEVPAIIVEYVPVVKDDALFLYVIADQEVQWCRLSRPLSDILSEARKLELLIRKSMDAYTLLQLSPSPDPDRVQEIQVIEDRLKQNCRTLGSVLFPTTLSVGGRSLSQALVGKSLIIIPHGALHNVPFSCLITNSGNSEQYLIDAVARLALAPSCETLGALLDLCASNLETKVDRVLLVGDVNEPSLPAVPQEFAAIGLAIGTDVISPVKAGLKERVQQSPAVHFAVHGFFDRNNPDSSGLRLADGVITSPEIRMLEDFETRLVSLSACETSIGATSAELDDVWSIASAFTFSGIPAVVGTFWKQDGAASADFFADFYRSIANNSNVGLPLEPP